MNSSGTIKVKRTDFITVFLFILLNGTIIGFQFMYPLLFGTIIWGAYRYYKIYHLKLNTKYIPFFALLFFMVVLNIMNIIYSVAWKKFCLFLLFAMAGFFCVSTVEKKIFFYAFSEIMVVISLISLILWMLVVGGLVEAREVSVLGLKYPQVLRFAFFGTRNAGPFWEPGGYQIFLNLSILFLYELEQEEIKIKALKWKRLILYTAVLTGQSTTGYICLFALFAYQTIAMRNVIKNYKRRRLIMLAIGLVGITLGIGVLMRSSVVKNKFDDSNYSYRARRTHMLTSIKMIEEKPILGYGYISEKYQTEYQEGTGRNLVNSSGFLLWILYFGIPFMLVYCYYVYREQRRRMTTNIIVVCSLLLVINFSECILSYPMFSFFVVPFFNERAR